MLLHHTSMDNEQLKLLSTGGNVIITEMTQVLCLSTALDPTASAAPTPDPRESPTQSLRLNPVPRSPALVPAPASPTAVLRAASHVPRATPSPDPSVAPAAAPRRSR